MLMLLNKFAQTSKSPFVCLGFWCLFSGNVCWSQQAPKEVPASPPMGAVAPATLATMSAPEEERLIAEKDVRLASFKDIQWELNEFQSDCLRQLRDPVDFQSKVELFEISKEKFSLRIKGKLSERSRLRFGKKTWLFEPIDSPSFEFQPSWEKKKIVNDVQGGFQFSIQIPPLKKIRVPVEIVDRVVQAYFMEIEFKEGREILTAFFRPYFTAEQRQNFCTKSRMTLATGITAFIYDQKMNIYGGNLKFTTFDGPSYSMGVDWATTPASDHSVFYRSAPSQIGSTDVNLANQIYRWNILDYHFSYGQTRWVKEIAGNFIYTRLRFGFQKHELPIVKVESALKFNIRPETMINGTFGVNFKAYPEKHWMIETQIGLQQPLTSTLDIANQTMIDGGIGLFAKYWASYFMGLQWYGHWHRYDYRRALSAFDKTGEIQFLYSSIELSGGAVF